MMPMVAGLFYGFNITISPIWSSIAMSCSSIVVVAFSHLLSMYEYDERKKLNKKNKSNEHKRVEMVEMMDDSVISPPIQT